MLKTKFFLVLFVCVGVLSSCKKDYDADKQARIDDAAIVDFIAKNSIVAVKHSSGLYYQVIAQGSGNDITISNTVSVNYEGRLLSGSVFDKSTTTATFPLSNLILGWQKGIPLVKKGGKIRLLIPSGLGYKNEARTGIPANSVLDFTVEVVNVQ
ncbi:FKBP-type peptidyl-prolyl cis-trans isomerase [Pedobacter sp. Hv1]|uniref:FKBP-type peptidyl-prolyl cis-trans isomerase n=1 Tax=Pedobacter sp. Hv1 TaxID=1740090 RepID=UPI0006D8B84C|nr:FKBP-type peptidyl-prolyl cis-trans isomerase [Pedobacter sp. Hv1]KQB99961.1 hypothetical protein AQF98_15760 [Pedobacter sp. Hv1]